MHSIINLRLHQDDGNVFYCPFFNVAVHSFVILQHCYYTCSWPFNKVFCFCNKYFLLMSISLIFVLFDLQKLSSWIIYKVHVHVHILPNQDWLVPELALFPYWSLYVSIGLLTLAHTRNDGVPHEQKPHHNNVLDIHVGMEHDC